VNYTAVMVSIFKKNLLGIALAAASAFPVCSDESGTRRLGH